MFFNAHAYYSIQKNGDVEPMRILGALLPDSALTGAISWTALHDKHVIQDFIAQLSEKEMSLGQGLMDHYELDSKSHDAYQGEGGYAFSHQTPQLKVLVARACGFESPEQALGLAHNFIEAGVDVNLLQQNKEIQHELRKALDLADISAAVDCMTNLFKTDRSQTDSKLRSFITLVRKYDLRGPDGWTALWIDIIYLLLHKKADKQAIKDALLLAAKLTAKDYRQVLIP